MKPPLVKPFYFSRSWGGRRPRFKTWRTDRIFKPAPPPSIAKHPQRVLRIDVARCSFGLLVRVTP